MFCFSNNPGVVLEKWSCHSLTVPTLILMPTATARTHTQCFKFIFIEIYPFSFVFEAKIPFCPGRLSLPNLPRNGLMTALEEARPGPFSRVCQLLPPSE